MSFSYNCRYCSKTGECSYYKDCPYKKELNPTPEMELLISHFLEQKKQNDKIIYQLKKLAKGM
jgi:hypothetical protein